MGPMFEGSVVAIFVAPAAGAPMEARDEGEARAGAGLGGDRDAAAAGSESGAARDEPETRRNLVTVGVPLNHLVDREFLVGPVRLLGVNLSEPCAYLERETRAGVREALVHRGGLRAE